MFTDDRVEARHLSTGKCLCQFIEEQLEGDEDVAEALDECKAPPGNEQQIMKHRRVLQASDSSKIGMPNGVVSVVDSARDDNNGSLALSDDQQAEMGADARSITPLGAQSNRTSSFFDQCDLFLPSLSHLVSIRERQGGCDDAFATRLDMADNFEQLPGNYQSKLIEGFASHFQQELADSRASPSTELSSSEFDDSSLPYRDDELIRKLRLLLEFRSSEFSKNLDGGGLLATKAAHQQTTSHGHQNHTTFYSRSAQNRMMNHCDNEQERLRSPSNKSTSSESTIISGEANESNQTSPMSLISKKFFTQADGLFFLGTRKGHQGVYAKQQEQMLQIC